MIHYRSGYKYQLAEDTQVATGIEPPQTIRADYVSLSSVGLLRIFAGYAWDGPSGPAIDTKNFMRGSLVHDALYQLMGEGKLDRSWRRRADDLLRDICREDGMSWLRANWVRWAVRTFAKRHAASRRPVLRAP